VHEDMAGTGHSEPSRRIGLHGIHGSTFLSLCGLMGSGRAAKTHAASPICTTMNIYGDALTEDMREAHGRIVRLALRMV
jgi:hypothetical protein